MTFDEWFNDKLAEYAGDNDMRKHHISSRWTYEKAWQASQAQQAQTIAELKVRVGDVTQMYQEKLDERDKTVSELVEALEDASAELSTLDRRSDYVLGKVNKALAKVKGK